MLAPHRSAAASTLPALVPSIRSTSPIGTGSRSWTAGKAPVIHAAPSTPPAPSTKAVRGRQPSMPGLYLTADNKYHKAVDSRAGFLGARRLVRTRPIGVYSCYETFLRVLRRPGGEGADPGDPRRRGVRADRRG